MKFPSNRKRVLAGRAALAAAMLAGGLAVVPHPSAHAALAASPKPDWRGTDLSNNGVLPSTGPASTPTQTFNAKPAFGGGTGGIELDGGGNVIFTLSSGTVYSYRQSGTTSAKNWQYPATGGIGTFGGDKTAGPSNPVVSTDGAVYIGNDNGNLYQISDANGAGAAIFNTPSGKGIQSTPKIGPDNSLYVGASDGSFYHVAPPTLGSGLSATALYTFTASGSTQTAGPAAGTTSAAPFAFYGEAALDAAGNAYVASRDTNPSGGQALGTLYSVDPTGAQRWKAPLLASAVNAVAYDGGAATPLVIVADEFPQVAAFNAATGAQVWSTVPAGAAAFLASPVVYNGVVYAVDSNSTLYALNEATGAPVSTFGAGGKVAIGSGSSSSPVVDAAGTLYQAGNTGQVYALNAATGATLFTIPGGTGAGLSGNTNPAFMSPAIGSDGTLYIGGNGAQVRGFSAPAVATATSTSAAATATSTSAATAPAATNTSAPTATNTAVPATSTSTTAPTATSTDTTAPTATSTNTSAPTATNTAVPATSTNTPVPATSTNTTAPTATSTNTNTPVPPTATSTNTNTPVPPTSTSTSTNTPTNTATSTNTPTNTATNTPTNTATSTSTPNATQTAVQQTAIAATATAAATQGVNLPNCQLIVLPNPQTVQRTGSEAVLFDLGKNFAGDTITATVTTTSTYPTTATLYNGAPGASGVTITGTPVANGYQFVFKAGPNGRALLDFPIPANAPIEKVNVTAVATENCAGGDPGQSTKVQPHTITRAANFNVEASQASAYGLHEVQSLHRILFRTVQPTGKGSVANDHLYINTAPNVPVTTTFTLSGTATSLGAGYSNGQTVYQNVSTSSITGSVRLTAPFTSAMLIPGKGGRLIETVQANIDGKVVTFRSQKAIREVNLRLLVQVQETTRGNRRTPFEIGNIAGRNSQLTVLVLCDPNAAISGAATVGSYSGTQTATCGAGGRAKLKYSVPNTTTPAKGTGTVTVTSTYRGATKSRTVNFHYAHKANKKA